MVRECTGGFTSSPTAYTGAASSRLQPLADMPSDGTSRTRNRAHPPIRIVCADAHPVFTLGVRTLLAAEPHVLVVGEAVTGAEALRLVDTHTPDVLILDLALEDPGAVDVLDQLALRRQAPRTIVVTEDLDADDLRVAVVRGARGVLSKQVEPALFIKCIRKIAAGEFWIGRAGVADLVDALRRPAQAEPAHAPLSQRERDIVDAAVTGASNKDIGLQLGLGEQTVKNHLRRAFTKLRVTNRVELAVKMAARKWAGPRARSDG